jgi:hypothetical protein
VYKLFRSRLITPLVLVALAPSSVYANVTMEYYTYGGFGPITSALNKISLIFSASAYQGLFFSAAVLGMFTAGMMVMLKSLAGAKGSIGGWAFSVVTGVVLYLALIVPKGSLVVYDPVMNQTQTIGNIPDGIVMISGLLNKVERGMVDLVSNTADPVGYQATAGGSNFDILNNLSSKGVLLTDQYLNTSLQNYVVDCVFFEMQRPGTTLDMNSLTNNPDFLPIFQAAASPAIYTTYFDSANESGFPETCNLAWTDIQKAITDPSQYTGSINARCADAGYDPTIPSELTACQSAISNTVNWLEAASYSATDVFRQFLIAQSISNAATSASPDTAMQMLATKNAATGMMGTAVMANQWIPVIKALMVSVAFCMVPLLALFIPTPIFPKALGATVGFFLWITIWGIVDAILHQFAIDYASTVATQIKEYQLGVTAVMNFSTFATKTLAAFGMIRWAGLILSTVIVGMLVKFGGAAMAQLAGSVTGHVQGAGSQAGHQIITPEGRAQTLGRLQDAPGVMANAHRWDFGTRADASTTRQMAGMGTDIGMQQKLGGGVEMAADRMANAKSLESATGVKSTEKTASALGDNDQYMSRMSETNAAQKSANVTMSEGGAKSLGISQMRFAEFDKGGKLLDKDMANTLNKKFGIHDDNLKFKEGMQAKFGFDSKGNLANVTGSMKTQAPMNFKDQDGRGYTVEAGAEHSVMAAAGGGMATTKGNIIDWAGHEAPKPGQLGHHEGHEGHVQFGSDGRAVNIKGEAGYNLADHQDTTSTKKDYAVEETTQKGAHETSYKDRAGHTVMQRNESGVDKQQVDINTKKEDHGVTLGHGLQQVMRKDKGFATALTNAKNEDERRAAIAAMSQSAGSDMANFYSRAGISLDSVSASANIGARMHGGIEVPIIGGVETSVAGQAGIEGRRIDQNNTNLLNRDMAVTIDKADKEASANHLTGDKHSQYVMDKLHDHVDDLTRKVMENNPDKFGASAPGAAMDKMIKKIKG